MTAVADLLTEIKSEAQKIDSCIRTDLEVIGAEVDPLLVEVLQYGLLSGGKRIRPMLVVLAARACGFAGDEVYRLGCAFEYLHAATLFHDDIIDNSDLRRGKDSVFKKFGVISAILAGDFLHALSMSIVGEMAGPRGLKIFCNATKGMVDGEFMQMRNAENRNMSELNYHDAIMGKTGLLISAACEVGGCFGGGTEEQIAVLRDYGTHLGCAFQIVDDLLDYLGNPDVTGKAVGNDLKEGKMTLPLILTLRSASSEDKQMLDGILADVQRRSTEFAAVHALIEKYNGFQKARERAEEGIASALAGLEVFDKQKCGRELAVLRGLAEYVLNRKK